MNADGDFEYYRYIWSGADRGWGVHSYPSLYGIEITFEKDLPSATEMKAIRDNWPPLAKNPISTAKSVIGEKSYQFGKWSSDKATLILNGIIPLGIKAVIVSVPNYRIVNFETNEIARIRNEELYELVTQTLIDNGGKVVSHSGFYPGDGALAVE